MSVSVMRGLREWLNEDPKARMVVVATHRRTTAAHADRIYQIAGGRLVNADDSAFDAAREVKIA